MFSTLLLIISDNETAEICKNKLQHDPLLEIYTAKSKEEAVEKVELFEPDLILLSSKIEQTDSYELCRNLRQIDCLTRPVITMFSDKTEDSAERIKGFMAGADDYLDTLLSDEEFSVRIYAHIRRHIEELSDQTTKLPGATLINTNIKRRINLDIPWALMLMNLSNIAPYNDTYGFLAGNQLMKAFMAIVRANIDKKDFFGHFGNEDFVILTTPLKVEIIAENLSRTVDQIVPKFYAPFEAERGYTIVADEGKASRKVPLVSVNSGIVANTYRHFDNYKTALSIAENMKNLAKYQLGSGWLLDRPLIPGDEHMEMSKKQNYVLVIESDAALAYLLTTTLEMQGYHVDATSNKEEAMTMISSSQPDIVLIDAVLPGDDGWDICSYIKTNESFINTKIIMATVHHDKEKAFEAGADLYIPKPYDLKSLHNWISRLIKNRYY